jgi:hypothetical protein
MRSSLKAIERQAGPNKVQSVRPVITLDLSEKGLIFDGHGPQVEYQVPHRAPLALSSERTSPDPVTAATRPSPDPDRPDPGTPPSAPEIILASEVCRQENPLSKAKLARIAKAETSISLRYSTREP